MKKYLLITDVEFWKENAGNAKRISQLILNFSENNIKLEVAFIGKIYNKSLIEKKYRIKIQEISCLKSYLIIQCKKIINKFPYFREKIRKNLKHTTIESLKSPKLKIKMERVYKNLEAYSGVIVEYIYFDYLVPEGFKGKKIIDTHDIQSDRYQTYLKQNKFCRFKISVNEEKKILQKYDYILLVSERDMKIASEMEIPQDRLIYLPIYEKIEKIQVIPSNKLRLGFIGAAIDFNIDAINWFIDNIFSTLKIADIELHIYGGVSGLVKSGDTRIKKHGFVKSKSDIYKNIDIVINPIQVGGGIKVKNIEALSKGKLLITTNVGAQGLEDGINKAFILADTKYDYTKIIKQYLKNDIQLKSIENYSVKYIERKLNFKEYYQKFFKNLR